MAMAAFQLKRKARPCGALGRIQDVDLVRIDDDIERCGQQRDQRGEHGEALGIAPRIGRAHRDDRDDQQQLEHEHPASAAAEHR